MPIGLAVAEMWRFNGFQYGDRHHLGFSKIGNFNVPYGRIKRVSSLFCQLPNFLAIGQTLAEIW